MKGKTMPERFSRLTPDTMKPEQRVIAEHAASGPKKTFGGSLNVWLHSPGVAAPVYQLGEYVRFSAKISDRLKELVVCVVTHHWHTQSTWTMHYDVAVKAGIAASVLDQIAVGNSPVGLPDEEQIVYDFVIALLAGSSMSDSVFGPAHRRFGEAGVVDLMGLVGYYCMVCMNKNVANVPPVAVAAKQPEGIIVAMSE